MSGERLRHDFGVGETAIGATTTHQGLVGEARDESSSLAKVTQGALGDDVSGSEQMGAITQIQFARDTQGMDSAARMLQSNQESQDIQQTAAGRAVNYFGNRG